MIRARLSPKAEHDLDKAFSHIAANNREAAIRVRNTILNTADFLAQHPELGRPIRNASPRHAQIRWFVVPRFRNYLIFYQPLESTALVVRVLHAAQDWMRFSRPPIGRASDLRPWAVGTSETGAAGSHLIDVAGKQNRAGLRRRGSCEAGLFLAVQAAL